LPVEPTLGVYRAPTQAKPPVVAACNTKGQKWLVMLYLGCPTIKCWARHLC